LETETCHRGEKKGREFRGMGERRTLERVRGGGSCHLVEKWWRKYTRGWQRKEGKKKK